VLCHDVVGVEIDELLRVWCWTVAHLTNIGPRSITIIENGIAATVRAVWRAVATGISAGRWPGWRVARVPGRNLDQAQTWGAPGACVRTRESTPLPEPQIP
jgi:hypothetical protein